MIAHISKPTSIQWELDQARKKAKRIRQSWSPEERRERFLRARRKQAKILSLLFGRGGVRGQAR
jgi:hypothetical protein